MNMLHSDMESIPVHITGTDIVTEEQEPEFFVCQTVVIPAGQQTNLVQLDPMRKAVAVYTPDGPCIVCHSEQQANSGANVVSGSPAPEGGFLAQGASINVDGTGPLWAVNPGASSIRVSVFQNRREHV